MAFKRPDRENPLMLFVIANGEHGRIDHARSHAIAGGGIAANRPCSQHRADDRGGLCAEILARIHQRIAFGYAGGFKRESQRTQRPSIVAAARGG